MSKHFWVIKDATNFFLMPWCYTSEKKALKYLETYGKNLDRDKWKLIELVAV